MRNTENKKGRQKSNYINNNTECDCIKQANQNSEVVGLYKKARSNDVYRRTY